MEYKDLITEVINEFPELIEEYKDEYRKIIGNQEPTSPKPIHLHEFHMQVCERIMHNNSTSNIYQFYEDIVRHYFIKLINEYRDNKMNNSVLVKIMKMIEFFEKMALSNDVEVENVLLIGVFEGIIDDRESLKIMFALLKENSRLLICRIQDCHDANFKNLSATSTERLT